MAGCEAHLYLNMFNFDRAGSRPIRPRVDRRQPLPAASLSFAAAFFAPGLPLRNLSSTMVQERARDPFEYLPVYRADTIPLEASHRSFSYTTMMAKKTTLARIFLQASEACV